MDDKSASMEIDENDLPEFTLAEVIEMDKVFKKMGEELISLELCQELAAKFSCSAHRSGKSSINWEQVQSWLQEKQKQNAVKVIPLPSPKQNAAKVSPLPSPKQNATSKVLVVKKRAKMPTISASEASVELSNLIFEARSAKDYAWFDVACFLNYRVLCSGDLEVRARFSGFGNEEDEWVSVKRAVRERSIPVEHSECDRVIVGDLVLTYRENEDHALYTDAYVMEIERISHDSNCCKCIFRVRYEYDNLEEKVPVGKICRRQTQSESRAGNMELNMFPPLTLQYETKPNLSCEEFGADDMNHNVNTPDLASLSFSTLFP